MDIHIVTEGFEQGLAIWWHKGKTNRGRENSKCLKTMLWQTFYIRESWKYSVRVQTSLGKQISLNHFLQDSCLLIFKYTFDFPHFISKWIGNKNMKQFIVHALICSVTVYEPVPPKFLLYWFFVSFQIYDYIELKSWRGASFIIKLQSDSLAQLESTMPINSFVEAKIWVLNDNIIITLCRTYI